MDKFFNSFNTFFLVVLPYMALLTFLVGTIWRYVFQKSKYSSLSSQFLESKQLFWGSVPFHLGIIFLFFGHLTAFLIPRSVLFWNSQPARLLILEVTAFVFGIALLIGLLGLFFRRFSNARLIKVTSTMDVVILVVLLLQVVTGLWVAFTLRWGSSWFASVLTPYLWSIFTLKPDMTAVAAMPWIMKLHISGAYLLVLLIPFSRLMHFLVFPFYYIGRPYQRVIWNRNPETLRKADSPWTMKQPRNN